MKRNYLFDNAKFVLIFLVVLGHFLTSFKNNEIIRIIYAFIYSFHMPAFIFISGYFSKNVYVNGHYKKNRILNYLLLYIVCQVLYRLITSASINIFVPSMALWYLLFMIGANLLLPFINSLNKKYALVISVIIGLIATSGDTTLYFSITRLLTFMPFFIMGYYFELDKIKKLFKKKYVCLSILIFILYIIFLYLIGPRLTGGLIELFNGKTSLGIFDNIFLSIALRMCHYILSSVLILCFLVVVPKTKNIFTYIGSRTLQIYLLHIPLVQLFVGKVIKEFKPIEIINTPLEYVLVIVFAFVITLVLSLKVFSYPFDKMMNIKFKKIYKS